MMGALAAGLAFGTAGTSIAHAVQYAVGALTHTAHGVGVACLMPYVMGFKPRHAGAELAEIGHAMGLTAATDEAIAEAAIAAVAGLFERIGIPPSLRAMNMPEDKLAWTAEQALGVDRLDQEQPASDRPCGHEQAGDGRLSGRPLGRRARLEAEHEP